MAEQSLFRRLVYLLCPLDVAQRILTGGPLVYDGREITLLASERNAFTAAYKDIEDQAYAIAIARWRRERRPQLIEDLIHRGFALGTEAHADKRDWDCSHWVNDLLRRERWPAHLFEVAQGTADKTTKRAINQ